MSVYVSTKDDVPLEIFDTLEECLTSIRKLKKEKGYWEFDTREIAEAALKEKRIPRGGSYNMYNYLKEVHT
jgi:hypothetical protein